MYRFFHLLILTCVTIQACSALKVLHLGYHHGIERSFQSVAPYLDIELTSWRIGALPDYFFDPLIKESASPILYNITHDRAARIWKNHRDFFNSFDVVITSDTAALARIFLQNGWNKPLIIWICNRFDFASRLEYNDCDFPDREFYNLFHQATQNPLVTFINFTPIEAIHANLQGINTGSVVIKPYLYKPNFTPLTQSFIPPHIVKSETFYIPYYYNNARRFLGKYGFNLPHICDELGIPNYCGVYNGPKDIEDFKGIIHIPYAFSTTSQFENFHLGLIHFVPSQTFFNTLCAQKKFFFANKFLLKLHTDLVEFYQEENRPYIVYFDSWKDLIYKIQTTDYQKKREEIKNFTFKKEQETLQLWKDVFKKIKKQSEEL